MLGDGVEGLGHVAIDCRAIALTPRILRGERGRFGDSFTVTKGPERVERLEHEVEPGARERGQRACASDQEPRSLSIVRRREREGVCEELCSRSVGEERKRPFSGDT